MKRRMDMVAMEPSKSFNEGHALFFFFQVAINGNIVSANGLILNGN